MSYQNISGLDLFQTPFGRTQAVSTQASRQQANRQKPNDTNSQPKPVASTAQIVNAKPQAEPAPKQDAIGKSDTQPKAGSPGTKAAVAGQGAHATQPKPFEIQPKTSVSGDVTAKKTSPVQEQAAASAEPMAHADTQKQTVPKKELVLDMSAGTTACSPLKAEDSAKRKADHEAAEAKRKADWEEKQRAKKQAEEAELQKLQDMTDEEAVAVATKRISTEVERITRRNMKISVSNFIQSLCRNPAFARLTMQTRKNMVNCFKYINRQAKEYVKQEMADNGTKPENGMYGCDIPDDIVYQWAKDYFNNPDVPEDKIKEEKFVPKPYVDTNPKTKKASDKNKKADKPDKKKSKDKQETDSKEYEQMTLGV